MPMPIPAAFAIAVGCAAAPVLTELEEAVLEGAEEVELGEGVGEGEGRVVLELWEEETEAELDGGGVAEEEGGVAEEEAEPVISGRICAGVFVSLGAGDGVVAAFWRMLACAA